MSSDRKVAAIICTVVIIMLIGGGIWSWPKPYTATVTVQSAAFGGTYQAGMFESQYFAIQTHDGSTYKCLSGDPACALIREGDVVEATFNDSYMTMSRVTILKDRE